MVSSTGHFPLPGEHLSHVAKHSLSDSSQVLFVSGPFISPSLWKDALDAYRLPS